MPNITPPYLLMIEDNDDDYEFACRSFRKIDFKYPIKRFVNGDDALIFLFKNYQEKGETPSVILLDLNLPGTDGRTILKIIKSEEGLRKVPVIVLTTSSNKSDIESTYADGANSYIQKPGNSKAFIQLVDQIKNYWFNVVALPSLGG